tara:strand:+ start:1758 stop:1964 length:207 start_codon:yes stop_codon:yes gene_type:complete
MIKVEGHPHLYRDEKTGAIINCDDHGYDQYVKALKNRQKKDRELDKIKEDIDEIKESLKLIISGLNKT